MQQAIPGSRKAIAETGVQAELTKVEEFLRMAEEFSKESDPDARLAFAKTA